MTTSSVATRSTGRNSPGCLKSSGLGRINEVPRFSSASSNSKHPSKRGGRFGCFANPLRVRRTSCLASLLKGIVSRLLPSRPMESSLRDFLLASVHRLDLCNRCRILWAFIVPPSAREPGKSDRETRSFPDPVLPARVDRAQRDFRPEDFQYSGRFEPHVRHELRIDTGGLVRDLVSTEPLRKRLERWIVEPAPELDRKSVV